MKKLTGRQGRELPDCSTIRKACDEHAPFEEDPLDRIAEFV